MARARLTVVLPALALITVALLGCISEDDLVLEERANLLETQLLCPVCEGQSLRESQAQIAVSMKALLREQLDQGYTNSEIRDFFVARYGEAVLAAPRAQGFGLLAWIIPAVIVAAGLLVLGFVLYDMRKSRRAGSGVLRADASSARTGGAGYRKLVERELHRYRTAFRKRKQDG